MQNCARPAPSTTTTKIEENLSAHSDGTVQLYRVRDELPLHLRLLIVEAGVSHDSIRLSALDSAVPTTEAVCGRRQGG